jgi:hypothetical protein
MSLTVTQRPNTNGIWNAIKNPTIYRMTRQDYLWTALVASGGNTSIQIATDVTAFFVTGDTIWLQSDDGSYSATGTVVSSAFGASTTVITTVPYVANNVSGYINTISKRSSYYVGVQVVVNGLTPTVNYYPTKSGLLTIDISQPLFSAYDPAISTNIINSFISLDSNVSHSFYINYTEYWTGSSNSPTDDSGNTLYGVYGSKQIGQDSYLSSYISGGSMLTKFDSINLIIGEYYALSWIDADGYANGFLKKTWYSSGSVIIKTYIQNTNVSHKTVYSYYQKASLTESLTPDRQIGAGSSWSGAGSVAAGATTKSWSTPIFIPSGSTWNFSYNLSAPGTPFTVTITLFDINGASITSSTASSSSGILSLSPGSDCYLVGILVHNSDGISHVFILNSLTITIPANRVDFTAVNIGVALPLVENNIVSIPLTANINSISCRVITLWWRNSLGGQSSWSFYYNQDYVTKLQDPFKNNWYTLYEQNLTFAQLNALSEMISVSQVYQTPVIELTSSIDKSEARIGQQVYIIDSNTIKTGVIVIPSENKTRTKNRTHSLQVTIQLPEIFG